MDQSLIVLKYLPYMVGKTAEVVGEVKRQRVPEAFVVGFKLGVGLSLKGVGRHVINQLHELVTEHIV